MSVNAFDNDIDMDEVDRKMRMLQTFMEDILSDPGLADLLPDTSEYLDLFERGSRPEMKPDFQTPNVDVYVNSPQDLHPNHRVG